MFPFRSILVPTDFTAALKYAAAFARHSGGRVCLFSVQGHGQELLDDPLLGGVDKELILVEDESANEIAQGAIDQEIDLAKPWPPPPKPDPDTKTQTEELGKGTKRDFPISLKNIRVVAVNVVKLETDNADPRRYLGRLDAWEKRVKEAGAAEWRVINDLQRLEGILARA